MYFAKPRVERALMVGTVIGKRALHAMQDYDNRPKPKKRRGKKS